MLTQAAIQELKSQDCSKLVAEIPHMCLISSGLKDRLFLWHGACIQANFEVIQLQPY